MIKLTIASSLMVAAATTANPIRKVVTLLQDMQKEIEAEGEKEEELFEKFMCFCKNNKDSFGKSASDAAAQYDELTAAAKAADAEKAQSNT
jgi:hypothetical protein